MKQYYRQKNSTYANYRYSNPNTANFIAPQAKVANFIDPSMFLDAAQQYGGDAINAIRQGAQGLGGAAQDLYAQGVAKTGINLPGMADQAGQYLQGGANAVRGAAQGVGNAAQDLYAQGVARTGINIPGLAEQAGQGVQNAAVMAGRGLDQAYEGAQAAGQYIQQHPGQDAAAAGGLGALGGAAALVNRLRRGRQAAQPAMGMGGEAAGQAPGMMQRLQGMPMAGKAALGVGGAGALAGAGALGYNAMQDEEAQYRANLAYNANFRKRTR